AGVVAVLPGRVAGGEEDRHAALARGLAQMVISDLSLLGRLRLVERIELDALLAELERAAAGRLDPATAPRVGRLVRAESVIQNLLVIDDGSVRIETLVTRGPDSNATIETASGSLSRLLEMEKDLALMLADRLAGPLTPAEERAILENGPESMAAFLDWADGLLLEDRGDFAGAAQAYRRAARIDVGFDDATDRSRAAAAAVSVIGRSPSEVIALGSQAERAALSVSGDATRSALAASAFEVAPLGPELALGGMGGVGGALTPGALQTTPALPLDVVLRILVRIPR
ncbi:MAG: CsgG/HfaB family protein, partial [Gemmatimonadetes bacterium]|nr:CsgG/HfaB family protein [Gemmatimonadota bacterium]